MKKKALLCILYNHSDKLKLKGKIENLIASPHGLALVDFIWVGGNKFKNRRYIKKIRKICSRSLELCFLIGVN